MLFVGVCRLELSIVDNHSLKGKRSVVKRVIQRCRNRYNVAMAEIDALDTLNHAVLGFAVVGNDKRFVNSCVDKVIDFIEELGDAPISDCQFEIEQYG